MKLILLLACAFLGGCTAAERLRMASLYKVATLPDTQVVRDIPYVPGSALSKHRLNLFHPPGKDWPVMLFVHGGGWGKGDRAIRYGNEDVYGNIGRFYAARGIGVAVMSYRLQPTVTWKEQVTDVAHALGWVKKNIRSYGGNSSRIFLFGHSAGAHLSSHVALHSPATAGFDIPRISGVICVSGAALDLSDEQKYRFGKLLSHAYFAGRFSGAGTDVPWEVEASPSTYVRSSAPPFLIQCASGDTPILRRQAKGFHDALQRKGVSSRYMIIPDEGHSSIVLALSREDRVAAPEILDFVARH